MLNVSHSSLDPRIKRIKQQEKEAREAKKKGVTPGAPAKKTKQQEEEEKKKAEEEAKKKEEEEKVSHDALDRMNALSHAPFLIFRLLVRRPRKLKPLLPTPPRRPDDRQELRRKQGRSHRYPHLFSFSF